MGGRRDFFYTLHLRYGGALIGALLPAFHWFTPAEAEAPGDLAVRLAYGGVGLAAFVLSYVKAIRPKAHTLWLLLATGLVAVGTYVSLWAPAGSSVSYTQLLYLIPLHLLAQSLGEDLLFGLAPLGFAGASYLFGRPVSPALPAFILLAAVACVGFFLFWGVDGFRRLSRSRTEEAIRERNFRAAVEDSIADALAVVSLEGVLIHANEALCRMTGFAREELVGSRMPFPYWPPEERETIRAFAAAVMERGEGFAERRRLTFQRKSGERFPVEAMPSPIYDENFRIVAWVSVIRDLSSEEKYRQELETLDRAIGVAEEGIAVLDAEGRYLQMNRSHERIYGYGPGELLGKTWKILYEPAVAAWIETGCLPVMRREGRWSGELVGRKKEGSPFPQEISLAALRDARGEFSGLVCVCRDITARKQAEEERTRALQLFEKVSETIEDGIAVLDVASRRWIYWNPPAEKLWGRDIFGKPTGDSFEEVGRLTDVDESRRLVAQSVDPHWTATTDDRLAFRDGRTIRRYTLPIEFSAAGHVRRRLHVYQDLTERVARERELEEVSHLKSDFLANTSHELRTPLNAIVGFLQLALDGVAASRQQERQFLLHAREASDHLLRLIEDLLDIARIEAGRMKLERQKVAVARLFSEMDATLRLDAERRGLTLAFLPPDDGEFVWADRDRLKQVLWNVVGNALKFTEAGQVRIAARSNPARGEMMFEVCDTGIGIPADRIPMLFQKFVQVDGSSTRRFGGSGLGLAITKALVEEMGGSIGIESAPGRGTRVWFTLPLVGRAEEAS